MRLGRFHSLGRWASPVTWAVALEGRTDPGGTLMLIEDRQEAENLALEIRRRGQRVTVRLYRKPGPDRHLAQRLHTSDRA